MTESGFEDKDSINCFDFGMCNRLVVGSNLTSPLLYKNLHKGIYYSSN